MTLNKKILGLLIVSMITTNLVGCGKTDSKTDETPLQTNQQSVDDIKEDTNLSEEKLMEITYEATEKYNEVLDKYGNITDDFDFSYNDEEAKSVDICCKYKNVIDEFDKFYNAKEYPGVDDFNNAVEEFNTSYDKYIANR